MKCPSCKAIMVTIEWDELEVDHCLACRGIWLDSGELALLVADEGNVESRFALLKDAHSQNTSERRCPICDKKMELVGLADRASPILDRCHAGHGLWFERGELEHVIQCLDQAVHTMIATRLRSMFAQ